MDRNLALEFVRVTEAAALNAARLMGKGDKHAADEAAVKAMRSRLNDLPFTGRVVIGEGERDEAPMLFIGEMVGKGGEPFVDIAVDPLEGTTPTAQGGYNAMAVLAAAPKGHLLHAPDVYMDKIAVGPKAKGSIDLDKSVKENIFSVAMALEKDVSDITVVVLDRERHTKLIADIRAVGARIRLIQDCDIAGAIAPCIPESGIDMLLGIGAAPEGVISAAALQCLGGEIQGRLHFVKEADKERAHKMGIQDLHKKLFMEDLAKGDNCLFVATGVTNGDMLDGVRFTSHGAITHSIVTRSKSGTTRFIQTHHRL
jgi:fructose-1,6-bisphosphatase II